MLIINNKKILLVGDRKTGKSSLITTFGQHAFPTHALHDIIDPHEYSTMYKGAEERYALWECTSRDDTAHLRKLFYPDCELFIIVYACNNPSSFLHAESVWVQDLQLNVPDVPYLLVATKIDLRDDKATIDALDVEEGRGPITSEEGQLLANRIGAIGYYEVSALNLDGVDELFRSAVPHVFHPKDRSKGQSRCAVM